VVEHEQRGHDQQPAERPGQNERPPPVRVLKEKQAADDGGAERAGTTGIEGDDLGNRD